MHNAYIKLMSWNIFLYKPRGNILTEVFAITVSDSFKTRHDPQCKVQIKDEIKISLSVPLMLLLIVPHSIMICQSILYIAGIVDQTMRSDRLY